MPSPERRHHRGVTPLHDYAITTPAPLHSDVPVRDVIATSPPCIANPP